jgi:hypothetical protein
LRTLWEKKHEQGGGKMKAKIFLLFAVPALIGFTFFNGFAKPARLQKPVGPESTLLMGRIKVICTNFPKNYEANGDYTKGITIVLKDEWNNIISVTSRGNDGFFHLVDPKFTNYTIIRFSIEIAGTRQMLQLAIQAKDVFAIHKNSVNNLGDLLWRVNYQSSETTEYSAQGDTQTPLNAGTMIECLANYEEVKSWFESTYPESEWKNKNWENIPVVAQQ